METKEGKKKILIVEDDLGMLKILVDVFQKENYTTTEAKDGEEGLAKALTENPDLILLDILMPKIDGLAVLKELRKTSNYGKQVPVILLTNLSPDKEKINEAIADNYPAYYLVKSNWNLEDIVEKVHERLARK